jgi:hypothetical protein
LELKTLSAEKTRPWRPVQAQVAQVTLEKLDQTPLPPGATELPGANYWIRLVFLAWSTRSKQERMYLWMDDVGNVIEWGTRQKATKYPEGNRSFKPILMTSEWRRRDGCAAARRTRASSPK